jgi:hypothetical protein
MEPKTTDVPKRQPTKRRFVVVRNTGTRTIKAKTNQPMHRGDNQPSTMYTATEEKEARKQQPTKRQPTGQV